MIFILRADIPATDLAIEARELATAERGRLDGVTARTVRRGGALITELRIETREGERAMRRPRGSYYTVELKSPPQECDEDFPAAVKAIGEVIARLLPKGDALVVGLGNRGVTPDALGPEAARRILVTRHITAAGGAGAGLFRPVTVICPGVLGQTGVESAEIVAGVAAGVRPACIVAIDALAARSLDRLGRTLQITDTGLHPGSGIGNHRQELSRETLGLPVIGVGVPTVISAATLVADALAEASQKPCQDADLSRWADLFVTPRDVDTLISRMAALIAYSVNSALHSGLTVEDMRYYGC